MRLSQICIAIAQLGRGGAWSPLSLWPDGIATPGMWISPRTLTSEWQDYTGTTPVAVPGTVADSANPVGLALDIRAGAPEVLGPELVTNGTFDSGISGWTADFLSPTLSWDSGNHRIAVTGNTYCTATTPFSVTAGKTYLLSATLAGTDPAIWFGTSGTTTVGVMLHASGQSIYTAASSGTLYAVIQGRGVNGSTAYFDNISVKEVPGNHMLQSTSAARPLMSARVNTLTYTEDFSNAIWVIDTEAGNTVTKTLGQADPLGGTSAVRLVMNYYSGAYYQCAFRYNGGLATEQVNRSWWIKSNTGDAYNLYLGDTQITTIADTNWHRYDVNESTYSWGTRIIATATNVDITVAFPQRELGSTSTEYQSVPGDGSTYATDFPIFQKYDGVDDGMATADFTTGTLIDGMDCMIVVRRDGNSQQSLGGLYQLDATKYFGVIGTDSGASAGTHGGCGTPSIFVDNVAVSNTRGALYDAIGLGEWHILEYRDLDMSAWVNAGFGYYASGYQLIGARGDILLFPSTASTEDKDAARQWLADYYGVTLP